MNLERQVEEIKGLYNIKCEEVVTLTQNNEVLQKIATTRLEIIEQSRNSIIELTMKCTQNRQQLISSVKDSLKETAQLYNAYNFDRMAGYSHTVFLQPFENNSPLLFNYLKDILSASPN